MGWWATIGCLITISDRIKYLNSHPTATTISKIRQSTLTFPAVTFCNLLVNSFRIRELEKRNLTGLIQSTLILVKELDDHYCEELESVSQSENLNNVTYEELTVQARHSAENFIFHCHFAGEPCGDFYDTENFESIFTDLGICYTFNSGKIKPPLQSKGTGQRQGLQLVVVINQSDRLCNAT